MPLQSRSVAACGRVIQRGAAERALRFMATLIDISKHKRTQQILEESNQRYRSIFNSMMDGVFLTESDGTILLPIRWRQRKPV